MNFVDEVLPIFSFIVSVVSLILAFMANKKTNRFAKQSLDNQITPIIKLTKLGLDPKKVKVYGGKSISWEGKNKISKELYNTISNSARTNSIVTINHKNYLLINLCYKDTPKDDIGIIVDAFYFELEYTKNEIAELMILKAYSLLDPKTPFGVDVKINTHINLQIGSQAPVITIPIAYACPVYENSSLNLGNIAKIAANATKEIDLIKTPNMAKQIICFMETAYLINCRTYDNNEFLLSLYMKKDNRSGELKTSFNFGSDQLYLEKYKKAKKKARKEIQQLAETQ